jgi:hypothetical protein
VLSLDIGRSGREIPKEASTAAPQQDTKYYINSDI